MASIAEYLKDEREKYQAKIEDYQQDIIDQIVKLIHDAQEQLGERDYADFIMMLKDILKEE